MSNLKILLIEDNEVDAKLIRMAFTKSNTVVDLVWVDRLIKGFELLTKNFFDAILLDLGLPDNVGIEAIDRIRMMNQDIPIIILTGQLDKNVAYSSLRKGAQDYIEKGVYTPDSLIRAIQYSIERKKNEITIQEQESALFSASKLMALGELTAFIFHEIGNPLAAINLSSQMLSKSLEEGDVDEKKIKKFLTGFQSNIWRITKILDGLKRYARDSAQEPFEEVFVKELFSGTVELCFDRFKSNNISFEVEDIDGNLKLDCRPVQITQVLMNLLNNAFDAVEALEKKWVKLNVTETSKWIEISVTDSGKGISEELSKKILENFFTTKPIGKGTGLGLSISKRIIEEHGGEFLIDHDHPNTRFIVRLLKNQKSNEIDKTKST